MIQLMITLDSQGNVALQSKAPLNAVFALGILDLARAKVLADFKPKLIHVPDPARPFPPNGSESQAG